MAKPNPFRAGVSLRDEAEPKVTKRTPLGLVEVESGEAEGVGIVKGVNLGSDYDTLARASKKLARVTVQFGEDPPALTKAQREKMDYDAIDAQRPPTSTFEVPPAMAKGLTIGDRVRVSIEKVSA